MKAKPIITIALLGFVAVSLIAIVKKEMTAPAPESVQVTGDKVILYYFHGAKRCATCRKFEAYTSEVMDNFAEARKIGRLDWQIINRDLPENKSYVETYELTSNSLVVVKAENDKVVKWQNLEKIWDLVKEKDDFTNYVQTAVREYLGEAL